MEIKALLQELCENLEKDMNHRETDQPHSVDFVSGFKPENYFSPVMHTGTTATIHDKIRMAWFVEIWIDGKCIIRQSYIPKENEDLKIVEAFIARRVLKDAFTFGVIYLNGLSKNLN